MCRKDRTQKIGAIIFWSGFILALIITTSSLVVQYRSSESATVASHQALVGRRDSGPRETLVWSRKSRDWALGSVEQFEDAPEERIEDCLWPEDRAREFCSRSDRIINQLKLTPATNKPEQLFKISIANDHSIPSGQQLFIKNDCKVSSCHMTHDLNEADAIVFPNADVHSEVSPDRRAKQIWIAHFLESPPNTFDRRFARKHRGKHAFNWTASYRSDSDIVTPYAKFVPYGDDDEASFRARHSSALAISEQHRALIESKQPKIAWFVSNCHARNARFEFAKELAESIQVDIYGRCGNLTCNKWTQAECLQLINREYKFYLAFENSNSREYITEKLFMNALGLNDENHLVIPIVMGPRREDYERLAPPESFIHVDDFKSAKELAAYLKKLANDEQLYYSYFKWKTMGRFIETKFICRLCAMLHKSHENQRIRMIPNIQSWWLSEPG